MANDQIKTELKKIVDELTEKIEDAYLEKYGEEELEKHKSDIGEAIYKVEKQSVRGPQENTNSTQTSNKPYWTDERMKEVERKVSFVC